MWIFLEKIEAMRPVLLLNLPTGKRNIRWKLEACD